jgi:ABC-type multidrug transport system ATPase subunit
VIPSSAATGGEDFEELVVENVSRHFGRRKALSKVSFTTHAGSILGLLGPNGAGKSTLLAVLATLLQPTSGQIRYGTSAAIGPDHGSEGDGAALRAQIGLLGHDLYLYPELTARENLVFFSALYGERDPGRAADKALARAGLSDRAHDPVSSFSRGMRQRVALERALIHRPRLLLLDEPFTGLDEASVAALIGRLRDLRSERVMLVVATHDLDVAEGLFDQVVFIRDGRIVEARTGSDALRAMYQSVMSKARA